MILTDEEIDKRLTSPDNLLNQIKKPNPNVEVLPAPTQGKTIGSENTPPLVRELIGTLSKTTDSTQKEVAEIFEVAPSSVSNWRRGIVGDRFKPELALAVQSNSSVIVDERTKKAHELALDSLVDTLTVLRPKLGDGLKPEKLSKIASDMSRVAKNLNDNASKREEDKPINNIHVILYRPQQKQESDYETIEA